MIAIFEFKHMVINLCKSRYPFDRLYGMRARGMSIYHDWVDWIGGWPFEAAKPEEVADFYENKGFRLKYINTVGTGYGNNEFVFIKK